ncbi:hypothetical protein AAU01_21480 [Paenarthrobacter aurescens]|uniref:Uncharacterized protein n=1 Tax=Paenarthrobacter aurescens TaxID=43663 RepID=A0A4Y3NDS5_PAEAU|nr:hypothetical protein AAU01_21480 [Paenarthrobacter aurescens]
MTNSNMVIGSTGKFRSVLTFWFTATSLADPQSGMDQGLERAERHTSLVGKAEQRVLTDGIDAFGVVFVLTKQRQRLLTEDSGRHGVAKVGPS